MRILEFRNDDKGYLEWVKNNPHGFVVNSRERFDPTYVVLHRASCPSVTKYRGMDVSPGGFTERGYVKICAASYQDLSAYLGEITMSRNPFSKFCQRCSPT